jgi:AraC-like DNA-binding protein
MLVLISQISAVTAKCILANISFSRFVMLITGESESTMQQSKLLCMRIQKVWNDYLNITCTVGISAPGTSPQDFPSRLQESNTNLTYKYIFGPGGIYTPTEESLFSIREAVSRAEEFRTLWAGVQGLNADELIVAQQDIFTPMYHSSAENAKRTALAIIYNITTHLADTGADLWKLFNTEDKTDFYKKINSLGSVPDVERWITNFIRWVSDYLERTQITGRMNIMEKAKRYIAENYSDCHLTLASTAAHVGLSEKYFSSRFAKENGESFVEYLTNLRISKAKQLIMKTDMKIYMISDAVGFNSVEHFTRVFKKRVGVSPGNYTGE